MDIAFMDLASNIVLGVAILLTLWLILSIRFSALDGDGIFPAIIPMTFLWIVAIAVVLTFHLSPFHLIWLFILSIPFGLIAIMIPPVQALSMGALVLLSMTGTSSTQSENAEHTVKPKTQQSLNKQPSNKKGFG